MSRMTRCAGRFGVVAACGLVAGLAAAQEQAPLRVANQPQGGGQPEARPPAIQAQIQTPKELELLLQTWEQRSAQVDRIQGVFKRYEYDRVFKTEKRADGKYWFEMPDKGRMDLSPDPTVPKAPDNKHQLGETLFTVEPDVARTWICTGKEILDIDIPNKTYNKIEIPVQFQGERISEGPLPFLFGMKAERMKKRYLMSFGEKYDPANPESLIHIVAFPLTQQEQREFQRAEVMLDPKTYLPRAVKLWDPTGNRETVYVFMEHKRVAIAWLPKAPWNVSLLGFKLLREYEAPAPDDDMSTSGIPGDPNAAPRRTATNPSGGILAR